MHQGRAVLFVCVCVCVCVCAYVHTDSEVSPAGQGHPHTVSESHVLFSTLLIMKIIHLILK